MREKKHSKKHILLIKFALSSLSRARLVFGRKYISFLHFIIFLLST
jgi:hypothetical protein